MSHQASTTSKFLGIATLGLLTGSSLTLTYTTLPTLFFLPSLAPASQSFKSLQRTVSRQHRLLSSITFTSLLAAWALSRRGQRHPYLLWTGLPVLGVWGTEWWNGREEKKTSNKEDGFGEMEVNGEVVRDQMEGWQRALRWKGLAWGIGWTLGLVGIWGDGA